MADSSPTDRPGTVNQQIVDALAAVSRTLQAGSDPGAQAIASQMLALAAGLAMQDAVAQQRQAYMLHNAATTALVNALLDSPSDRAEHIHQAMREIRESFDPDRLTRTLSQIDALMDRASRRSRSTEIDTAE
jgi:hypothetical protein